MLKGMSVVSGVSLLSPPWQAFHSFNFSPVSSACHLQLQTEQCLWNREKANLQFSGSGPGHDVMVSGLYKIRNIESHDCVAEIPDDRTLP